MLEALAGVGMGVPTVEVRHWMSVLPLCAFLIEGNCSESTVGVLDIGTGTNAVVLEELRARLA